MPSKLIIKSVILPANVFLFFSEKQTYNSKVWNFFNYPSASCFIIAHNYSAAGFALSKVLPMFTFVITDKAVFFLIKFTKQAGYYTSVLNYAFNSANKTIAESSFGFVKLLQFVGFRFRQRWFRSSCSLRLRLGYNKKVWVKGPNDFVAFVKKHNPKRRTNYFFSFDKEYLKFVTDSIYEYRRRSNYKGRGINLREQPMEMKEGKKTLW